MKSIKVFPSAVSATTSYYLREVVQKLASKRQSLPKWKESIARLSQSLPSSPARTLHPPSVRVSDVVRPEVIAIKPLVSPAQSDADGDRFENQMTDWMKVEDENGKEDNKLIPIELINSKEPKPPPKKGEPSISGCAVVPKLTRSAANLRTKQLVKALRSTSTTGNTTSQVIRLQELSRHLILYPEAVGITVNEGMRCLN